MVLTADTDAGKLTRDVPLAPTSGLVLVGDRAIYEGGASMRITVRATEPAGTAFVDAVVGGRTLFTQAVELSAGEGEVAFDLPADVHGPVRLRAFRVDGHGRELRSERIVLVRSRSALDIATTLDAETYRPGETAKLSIAVTRGGEPAPAAVSLAGVDEAVFALSESRPGMERAYFEMSSELTSTSLNGVLRFDDEAHQRKAAAALSAVEPVDDRVQVMGEDSYASRVSRVAEEKKRWYERLIGMGLTLPLLAALLMMLWIVGRALRVAWATEPEADLITEAGVWKRRMRHVLFAWLGGIAFPVIAVVLAAFTGNVNILTVFSVAGVLSALWVIGHFSRHPDLLAMLEPMPRLSAAVAGLRFAYALLALGVTCAVIAMSESSKTEETFAILLFAASVLWLLVFGALAAAGGATRRRDESRACRVAHPQSRAGRWLPAAAVGRVPVALRRLVQARHGCRCWRHGPAPGGGARCGAHRRPRERASRAIRQADLHGDTSGSAHPQLLPGDARVGADAHHR